MNLKITLILSLLVSASPLLAQEQNPLINSSEIIKQASHLHDERKYKEALDIYSKIGPSDTNYIVALYEKARTCDADSQFQKAREFCEEAISIPEKLEMEPALYALYGDILDNMGHKERALQVFDSAIVLYPAYTNLYLNKATSFIRAKKFAEAEKTLQEAILIDPYSSNAHLKLAISNMQQGKSMPAFLGFLTSLLINPDGPFYKSCINLLSSISKSEDGMIELINARKAPMPENFVMIEQIVLSKIALDRKYKALIKLEDPISRQLQVILEKLEFDPDDKDFYMQYYVPLYKKLFDDKQFEILVNHSFSGVEIPAITAYLKKNKKEKQELVNEVLAYFERIRSTREIMLNARKTEGPLYYFSDGELVGKGLTTNGGKTIVGPWTFFYPAGNIKASGTFNDKGEKDGGWKYYHFNGRLRGDEIYQNGKQEGEEHFYYDNGNLSSHCRYSGGQPQGINTRYFRLGGISVKENFKDGKLNGERKVFYSSGLLKAIENYADDLLQGTAKTYYKNGKPERELTYLKGKLNGPFKWLYDDGTLAGEGQYLNDEQTGTWKRYHTNGKLKNIENYLNGKLEGEYTEYYNNGQLFTRYMNRKGKTSGEVNYFSRDGKLYSVLVFENDRLKTSRYFDTTGKQIASSESTGKKLEQSNYDSDGFKWRSGFYNEKGNMEGEWNYYYSSGTLKRTETYLDGVEQGPSVAYYPNKKKSYEISFKEGEKDGYYTSHYIHGIKDQEGWYKGDMAQGDWLYYDERGNRSQVAHFLNDELDGVKTDYYPEGKIKSKTYYKMGSFRSLTQYDTSGKILHVTTLVNGNGTYKTLHLNGRTRAEGNYVNGNLHGVFNYYFFDGSLETRQFYKHGLLDSTYRDYFHGNKLHIEGRYELDKKEGTWKYYTGSGELSYTEEYRNGELHGKRIYYYPNGKIETESSYENGSLQGFYKRFTSEGILVYQLRYDNDERKGYSYLDKNNRLVPEIPIRGENAKITSFFPNGNKSAVFEYADGKMVGPDNLYHINGNPDMESTEVYGNTEGSLKRYYEDGKLKRQYNYLHNNLDGNYRLFSIKGILTEEGHYYNGSLHGPQKYYDDNGKLKETRIYYYGHLLDIKK